MDFDLTDLRAFVAVADTISFKSASRLLGLGQPVLSRRIVKLEKALGFGLFDRTTRRVEITEAGQRFLPRARSVLSDLDRARADLADISAYLSGGVSVACTPSLIPNIVGPAINAYHRSHAQIRLRLLDAEARHVESLVLSGAVDFGVASLLGVRNSALATERLFDEELLLICPRTHPLARRRKVSWTAFARHDALLLSTGDADRFLVNQALVENGVHVNWYCEVQTVSSLVGLVEAGVGIGAVPRMAVSDAMRTNVSCVRLVDPPVTRPVGILSRQGHEMGPAAAALVDILRRAKRGTKAHEPRAKLPGET